MGCSICNWNGDGEHEHDRTDDGTAPAVIRPAR